MFILNLKKSMTHEKKNRQILMQEGKCSKNTYQKKHLCSTANFWHVAVRDWFKVHSQEFWNIFLTWLKSNMQSANVRPSNAWFTLLNLGKCDLSFGAICISAFPSGSPDQKKKLCSQSPVRHVPYELRIAV